MLVEHVFQKAKFIRRNNNSVDMLGMQYVNILDYFGMIISSELGRNL